MVVVNGQHIAMLGTKMSGIRTPSLRPSKGYKKRYFSQTGLERSQKEENCACVNWLFMRIERKEIVWYNKNEVRKNAYYLYRVWNLEIYPI